MLRKLRHLSSHFFSTGKECGSIGLKYFLARKVLYWKKIEATTLVMITCHTTTKSRHFERQCTDHYLSANEVWSPYLAKILSIFRACAVSTHSTTSLPSQLPNMLLRPRNKSCFARNETRRPAISKRLRDTRKQMQFYSVRVFSTSPAVINLRSWKMPNLLRARYLVPRAPHAGFLLQPCSINESPESPAQ